MAKAKWLLEGSNLDLVNVIEKGLAEGASDKDAAKVSKAVAELKERFEADQAEPSVMGLLAKASGLVMEVNNLLDQAGGVYQSDIEAAGQPVVEETAPEVEEAPKKKRGRPKKVLTPEEQAELEAKQNAPKRGRGRPKKVVTVSEEQKNNTPKR